MLVINIPWELTVLMNTRESLRKTSGEKGTLAYCWWECKSVHSLWKNSMEDPQKIKNRPVIQYPTTICVSKANKIGMRKRHLHFQVYCSTIYNNQKMQAIYQVIHGFKNIQ